jgi:hypothetical protein
MAGRVEGNIGKSAGGGSVNSLSKRGRVFENRALRSIFGSKSESK